MTTYAVSDLHGCKVFYDKIKEYIEPTDIVYCLGDAGDRGPEPWETLKVCLDDPQFIYIRGNHDEMLLDVMKHSLYQESPWELHSSIQLLYYNGGMETYEGWLAEDEATQRYYYQKLSKTCLTALYGDTDKRIYLSHAGGTPGIEWQWKKDEVLWSREHFADTWPAEMTDTYVVHGHTPVDHMQFWSDDESKWEMYVYADGHKIDIDTGAKWSGVACLLNLDTFEPIYFKAD